MDVIETPQEVVAIEPLNLSNIKKKLKASFSDRQILQITYNENSNELYVIYMPKVGLRFLYDSFIDRKVFLLDTLTEANSSTIPEPTKIIWYNILEFYRVVRERLNPTEMTTLILSSGIYDKFIRDLPAVTVLELLLDNDMGEVVYREAKLEALVDTNRVLLQKITMLYLGYIITMLLSTGIISVRDKLHKIPDTTRQDHIIRAISIIDKYNLLLQELPEFKKFSFRFTAKETLIQCIRFSLDIGTYSEVMWKHMREVNSVNASLISQEVYNQIKIELDNLNFSYFTENLKY